MEVVRRHGRYLRPQTRKQSPGGKPGLCNRSSGVHCGARCGDTSSFLDEEPSTSTSSGCAARLISPEKAAHEPQRQRAALRRQLQPDWRIMMEEMQATEERQLDRMERLSQHHFQILRQDALDARLQEAEIAQQQMEHFTTFNQSFLGILEQLAQELGGTLNPPPTPRNCEKHLQPHLDAAAFKNHKLVEPSKNLQENICYHQGEVMEMFCRTDQKCICYLCSVDEHRGHDTVSAAAERTERQRELEESQQQIQQRIQDREKEVKLLQQEVEAINHSADQTVKYSEKTFTEMIRLIQKRSCEVKNKIRSQQQTEVSRVKDLQEKLEQEITELKRRDADLKLLSLTEDHSQFLLNYPSLPPLSESTHSSSINVRPLRYFEDVTAAVSELRDKLQDILRDERTNISLTVTNVDVLLPEPEPKMRADFLQYSCQITLDPNTANRRLLLSEENRKMTLLKQSLSYSDHSDRFPDCFQVLSRESMTGRCYWEVELRGGFVRVAVAYKNISRSGDESEFGSNEKSWALDCSPDSFSFFHNDIQTSISAPVSSRVGVYLDHRAGVLSFYSVSESMTLLHRVQTTFTQPLHAGLRVFKTGDTAEFCKLRTQNFDGSPFHFFLRSYKEVKC